MEKPIRVRAGNDPYDVIVGRQMLAKTGVLVVEKLKAGSSAVISDHNVAARFADTVVRSLAGAGCRPTVITVAPGEESK